MARFVNAAATRKLLAWLLKAAIGLCALYLCLLFAIYFFLERDPNALVQRYLGQFETRAGLKFSVGSIDVSLLPLPSLAIADLRVKGKDIDFFAAWLSARPSFRRILYGDFFPGIIAIRRSRLNLKTPFALNNLSQIKDNLSPADGATGKGLELPGELSFDISQFNIAIQGENDTRLALNDLEALVDLKQSGALSGEIEISSLGAWRAGEPFSGLDNCQIKGETNISDFFAQTPSLNISTNIWRKGAIKKGKFEATLASGAAGMNARGKLDLLIEIGAGVAPLKLEGSLTRYPSGEEYVLHDLAWQLGNDSGNAHLTAVIPANPADFAISGVFFARRASLSEWLGFTRNLPPGLQLALDNITRARVDFDINAKGLLARYVEGDCAGSHFTGSGGIASWSKPVILLDVSAPLANLERGLPEALGESPAPPLFAHPPLIPLDDQPLAPGENGIGYDIRVSMNKLLYGPLKFSQADVKIYPGKLDKSGFRDVLIDCKSRFYGSGLSGSCILGGDPSLPSYFTIKADDINAAGLAKDLAFLPIKKGLLDLSLQATSRGKKLSPFLANLKGDARLEGANVVFSGMKDAAHSLRASARLRSASKTQSGFAFDGQWRGDLKTKEISASCEAGGDLRLVKDNLIFSNLEGSLEASLGAGILPSATRIKLSGAFSGDSGKRKFEIARGRAELFGEIVNCNIELDAAKTPLAFHGDISAKIANLRHFLANAGFKNSGLPPAFYHLDIKAALAGEPDSVRLANIHAKLGATSITGSAGWRGGARNLIETELNLDRLDLAAFGGEKTTASYDFPALRAFDAKGHIRVGELMAWDLRFANLRVPYNLANGRLKAGPVSGNFYGAPLKCELSANFGKGLSFAGDFYAHAFNLGQAAQARKADVRLTGSASIDAKVSANVGAHGKIAPALNGQWSVSVANGSWQSLSKDGKPKGKPTSFNSVRASGKIINGRLESDNFALLGDGLKVAGKGSFNLASQNIDCEFNVDMKGLPDFPVWIYGPLANVKTSIGAGKLALNAAREVVSGLAGAVGGALKGVWNIFSK